MRVSHILLAAALTMPAAWAEGLAMDSCSTGTIPVGTTFTFAADSTGSGDCHTNPNLIFANVSTTPWFNLLITGMIPGGLPDAPTCDPDSFFVNCTATFNPNTHQYSSFFFGEDATHHGIQISVLSENSETNQFGFVFSGFPANQVFTASANVPVPEPSSLALMLTAVAVMARAISLRRH